jgi:purine-binding chemotaxis protein CheW
MWKKTAAGGPVASGSPRKFRGQAGSDSVMIAKLQQPTADHLKHFAGKPLNFKLSHESYGFDVLKVREIIRHTNIPLMPHMRQSVRGGINLRGRNIQIMDLRICFDFSVTVGQGTSYIVVAQAALPVDKLTSLGLVVDGVEEVVQLNDTDSESTPDFGGQISANYLIGIAKVKGAIKALRDIECTVGADSLKQFTIPAV